MNREVIGRRRGDTLRATIAGVAATGIVLLGGVVVSSTPASAADSSAVTVTAKDQDPDWENSPFPELEFTVSQTTELLDQGIALSWKGAKRSTFPDSGSAGTNFLQIMQCWGDEVVDGEVVGPDRTTCQYGATLTAGNARDNFRPAEVFAEQDRAYTAIGAGAFGSDYTSIPFRSVTGVTVASVVEGQQVNVDVNTNQFFTRYTTNEVPWAGSGADGTGSLSFELQTALLAPGLGCGAPLEVGGETAGRSCWLVAVPRGTADVGEGQNIHSGLFWDNWKHRLAVKLDFRALGVRCPIGATEQQVVGSELAAHAVASWQPALCGAQGGSSYAYITSSESDAVQQANLASGSTSVPLALASRSLGDAEIDQLEYAPIALAGVSLAFAIDRAPLSSDVPADVAARARLPFESMRLTPRLVAKLLTYSYRDSLPAGADRSHIGYVDNQNPGKNPRNVTRDPDFLAVNDPEWGFQGIQSVALSDLLIPQGRSDVAWAMWQYVLADDEARRFLEGEPDQWGMVVNPWYAITDDANESGTAFALPRNTFPKADPIEVPAADGSGAINLVTWRPYANDLEQGGLWTLRGDGQVLGSWDPNAIPPRYGRNARDLPGAQKVIGLTDTASAERFQIVSAELLNPADQFVAPTTEAMEAAAAAMTRDAAASQVLGFDPTSPEAQAATNAYPLTLPIYAVARSDLGENLRGSYADFIRYAVADGQVQGESPGELPEGYAPLPDSWRAAALEAADAIQNGRPAAPSTSPAPSSGTAAAATVTAPRTNANPGSAAAPAAAASEVVGSPAAEGAATTVLAGPKSPVDNEIGAFGAIVPVSAGAGLAAAVMSLFFSRRRLV